MHTGQDLPESDQHGSRREILIEPEHFWRNISTYSRFMAWRWEKVPGTSWVILLLCKNLLKGEIKAVWIIGVWPNMAVASQTHKRRRYWLTMYHTYLYLCLRTNQLCKVKRQLGKRPRRVAQYGPKSNLGHCDTLTLSSIHGMFTPSAKQLGGPVMWLFKDSFLDTGLEIWSRSHPIDFSGKNRGHIVFLLCHSHKEFLQDDVLEDKLHMLTKISFYHSHQWEAQLCWAETSYM